MKQIVAVIFGLGLLCNALLFVPQAIAVWRKKTDEGISLITFGGFSVLQAIGIVHGLYQQDLSLILGMAASLLSCGTVTFLTLFTGCGAVRSRRSLDRHSVRSAGVPLQHVLVTFRRLYLLCEIDSA